MRLCGRNRMMRFCTVLSARTFDSTTVAVCIDIHVHAVSCTDELKSNSIATRKALPDCV